MTNDDALRKLLRYLRECLLEPLVVEGDNGGIAICYSRTAEEAFNHLRRFRGGRLLLRGPRTTKDVYFDIELETTDARDIVEDFIVSSRTTAAYQRWLEALEGEEDTSPLDRMLKQ